MKKRTILCVVFAMIFALTMGSVAAFAEEPEQPFSITNGETTTYYETLKAAVDAAVDGDTILVHKDADVAEQATVNNSRNLTLQAAEGVQPVLTRGETYTGSLIVVEQGAALKIEGITLDGGAGSDSFAPDLENAYEGHPNGYFTIPVVGNAGLADCDPIISTTGSLEVMNSVLRNNYRVGTVTINKNGGAINALGGTVSVTGTTFEHNLACYGPAVYALGAASISLEDCTFEKNFAVNVGNPEDYESGGTVYVENTATTTVEGCDFTNNTVSIGNGGGIYVKNTNSTAATLTVNDTDFIGNVVGNDGFVLQVNNNVTTSVSNCNMIKNIGIADPSQSVAAMSYMQVENYCVQEISNCVFDGNKGPVSCISNHGSTAVIEVEDTVFKNNTGTLALVRSSSTSFTNCDFVGNEGLIFSCAAEVVASETVPVPQCTISECTITGNTGTRVLNATVMGQEYTPYVVKIEDSEIKENTADGYGLILGAYGTDLTISDTTIQDNSAVIYGGAVYVDGSTLEIDGSTLQGNSSTSYGGAIYAGASIVTIKDSTLQGNTSLNAGAIINRQAAEITLENTTITKNSATNMGGGIVILGESVMSADATTKIYDNTAGAAADDVFLQSSGEKNPEFTVYDVGSQNVTVTCGEDSHPIDGWYTDDGGARWNAHDSEKTYIVNLQKGSAVPYVFTGTTGGGTTYALKAAHGYLINYVLDGGTNHEDNPASYVDDDGAIPLQDPVKDGYIFDGWYTDDGFADEDEITQIPEDSQGEITLYAKWLKDENKDNIPDIYQKEVTFEIENGSWSDGTNEPQTVWVTLTDEEGNWSETGTGALTAPTGMEANQGYGNGAWDTTPPATVTGNEAVTYTYSFEELPVPDDEVRYFVHHYKADENGDYPDEPTDTDLGSGKPGETATGTPKDYEGYCLNTQISVTSGELTQIESEEDAVTLAFYYDKDVVGENGPEPDGIPDRYQKEVTFEVENGTWSDGTSESQTVWVTLTDEEGNWSETGTGTLTVPSGMEANQGYGNGAWDTTPPATVTGREAVSYTYSFEELPAPDGEIKYYVEHYKAGENGEYPTEPTEREVLSGKVGDTVTGTGKGYEGYCLNSQISVTSGKLVVVETDADIVVLKFFYDKDEVGEKGSQPDGIPDKYQKEVTFAVENGTWSDGTAEPTTIWVTLTDENGNWSETGTGTLTAPTGMKPDTGYEGGAWDNTPPATVTGKEAASYTYSFELSDVTLSYEKQTSDKPKDTAEELPYGTVIYVDPNGGKYNGSKEVTELTLTEDTELDTPTRSGYTFNGWKVSVDKETGCNVYTAQWTKIPTTGPDTGDNTNIHMWTWLFALSGAAMAVCFLPRKPKGKYVRR